ncbi:unnamed protein product [Lactuca saligna]|uniref:Uncharacterized protein n=1 Tax=Lactuca saligna TaxID=75948 RepID=A0AA35ZAA3_LACSI|nr:unnamed protein product [Lactuca saligna]
MCSTDVTVVLVSWDFLWIIFNISACYPPLDEACIWRQTRGTATETLGAENKAKSTEKVQLQFTNLPFRFLKYFINPILSYLSYRVCMFWDPCDQNFRGAPTILPVVQFAGQHPGGLGVLVVGMAFPGYVT